MKAKADILSIDENFVVRVEYTRRRNLCLIIKVEPLCVVVRTPENCPKEIIKEFCLQHRQWINDKLSLIKRRQAERREWKFELGEKLPYLGDELPFEFLRSKRQAIFSGNKFGLPQLERRELQDKIFKLYRQLAEDYLKENTFAVAELNNLPLKQVTIRDSRGRWGSCSSRGNINYSFRLIFFPPEVVNYVIVHELAHMVHMNHSADFWRLVGEWCPDYKVHRAYLRTHGNKYDGIFL